LRIRATGKIDLKTRPRQMMPKTTQMKKIRNGEMHHPAGRKIETQVPSKMHRTTCCTYQMT
jgi:hypothetical protein